MTAAPAVPGLVLDRELGAGRFGPVWRGLDLGTGEAVAVRLGVPAADAGSAAREGALLRGLEHENLVRLRAVVDLPAGGRAVVTDLAAGGSLADLVERRGEPAPGEVVTVAVGVARGLAEAHAHGFVHGALTPRAVLLDAYGRPQLADLGLGALLAPADGDGAGDGDGPAYPSPADDVAALGEVLRHALRGGVPGPVPAGPLRALVESCLAADPHDRPTAHEVALLAPDAAPPAPIALPGARSDGPVGAPLGGVPTSVARGVVPAGPAARRVGGSRTARRVALVIAAVAAGFALLAGALALALFGGLAASRPVPSAGTESPVDVTGVVAGLASARARAFAAPSEPALALVDAPGSAASAADAAVVRRLRERGLRLSGLSFAVSSVRLLDADAGGAIVEARVATGGYAEVRADGSVARRVAATPAATVRLTLVGTPAGWRITTASQPVLEGTSLPAVSP